MVDLRIKQLFFDRPKVQRAMKKTTRQALSRAGAFIRTSARSSIRKRKGAAPPGRPPHSHVGLLKRFIFFGYDRSAETVVIGPARISRTSGAPHTLEFGGTTVVESPRGRGKRGKRDRRKVRIAKRPYMAPALEKERSKLPKLWANSVRGG